MERRLKRTIIDIPHIQPELDFAEAEHSPPFTFPEYQREILPARLAADLTDIGIVGVVYLLFIAATYVQMPEGTLIDRRMAGIYAAGYLTLVAVYYLLFMLSASQTPGMKLRGLIVVSRDGDMLNPGRACLRGFGYFISILPLMLGFVWPVVDPEHLSWADKVSGAYVKKL